MTHQTLSLEKHWKLFPATLRSHYFQEAVTFAILCIENVNLFSTGSQDGRVHVWGSDSGQKLTVLEGNHPGPIQCVGFNPKYMMLASACTNMVSSEYSVML